MALKVSNLEGNEIADDYVRQSPTGGRWSETWGVFKSCFGKLILINIFILITFLPGVAIMIFRSLMVTGQGAIYPFNPSLLINTAPNMQGGPEGVYLAADLIFYSLLIVAGFIASLGISGGAYSIKKLLNTHGQFSVKGFFHGIKVGFFNTVLPVTVFMAFFFGCVIVGDWKDMVIAQGASRHGPLTAYAFMIIATILVGLYCGWLLATGISYRVKFIQLIKNSFVLMVGSIIQTMFFAGFALIPVWLYLIGGVVRTISYIVFILLGFSFILLVWMSFTQGVFDMFITPNLKAAEEAAKANKSPKQLQQEKEEEDKRVARELLAAGKSELIGKPILPVSETASVTSLGSTFTRADLGGISENRKKLAEDIRGYEEAHRGDPVYAEYNKLFAERERALKASEGKKKNKKKLGDNLLK